MLSCHFAATGAILLFTIVETSAGKPSWTSLPIDAPATLSNLLDRFHYVNVSFGTPPQPQPVVVSVADDKLVAFNYLTCAFCPGSGLFNPSLSSSFQGSDISSNSSVLAKDSVYIGGLVSPITTFNLINEFPFNSSASRFKNGILGLLVNTSNETSADQVFLPHLYNAEQLLNPVVGMSFHPNHSKISFGALDPDDYVGFINWVPITDTASINIDGIIGANGSMLPFSSPLQSLIDSIGLNIWIPNSHVYFENEGYSGFPQSQMLYNPTAQIGTPDYSYLCNQTTNPFVSLAVQINGIQYPITSSDLLQLGGIIEFGSVDYCIVGMANSTRSSSMDTHHSVQLGLPFMRSVYMAYRFPTDSCPGYYGFAFPANNSLPEQILQQVPRTTPPHGDECLIFTQSTQGPIPAPTPSIIGASNNTYTVYGQPQQSPVQLLNVDILSGPSVRGPSSL